MEYNTEEAEVITALLNEIRTQNLRAVVPRGHSDLPQSVPGGDIDLVVPSEEFDECIALAKDLGFNSPPPRQRLRDLCSPLIEDPAGNLQLAAQNPKDAIDFLRFQIGTSDGIGRGYQDWKGYYGDAIIHIMNHLAYPSPMNGAMIRVNPAVEKSLFEDRNIRGGTPIPAPADELAHLVCRGIFAKDGDFPPYYVDRCEELKATVYSSATELESFSELLSLLFFDADELVLDLVDDSRYDDIKDELLRYSEY